MNASIYKIVLFAAMYFCTTVTFAQTRHELSIYGGGGLSSLNYKLHNINNDAITYRPGGMAGIGYTFYFSPRWGISTGIELTTYRSESDHYSLMDTYQSVDDYKDSFDFSIQQKGYSEKQTATYLNIPLMLRFRAQANTGFTAALGGKIGIPVKGEYEYSYNSLVTKAYYPRENVSYEDLDFRGIGQFGGGSGKGDLEFDIAFMLAAEAGMNWSLGGKMYVYSGVYADYGLNNINQGDKRDTFLPYNAENPVDFRNNSILKSKYNHYWDQDKAFTERVNPLALGIKVKLTYAL